MARSREFLPRSFFELPTDDKAIVGRGPNLPAEHRVRLRRAVGRDRPNEPGDVAMVETLVRMTGDPNLRFNRTPTGLYSMPLDAAIRRFQRRNGLLDDGIVNPDAETLLTLEDKGLRGDDAQRRRREAACIQNRVRLDNLQLTIDEVTADFEAANARVIELSREAERFNTRHDLQLAIVGISAIVPAALAIQAGRGIVAALYAFVRSLADNTGEVVLLRDEADGLAIRFENAIDEFEFQGQLFRRRQEEMRELLQQRAELGCD